MPLRPRAIRVALFLLTSWLGAAFVGASTDTSLVRLTLLPLSDRATIVVDLSEPVAAVEDVSSAVESIEVEAGPIRQDVQPATFVPDVESPFVARVVVRRVTRSDGVYLRLQVHQPQPGSHRLRGSGSRFYIDLRPPAPPPAPPAAPARAAGNKSAAPATAPRRPAQPQADAAPSSEEKADAAYRELESSTLRRARSLAARPDVRGLQRLATEVARRDAQLGQRRPEVLQRLNDELQRYTLEAQTLQLQKDRELLLKANP
jgi:hypothetical protein